MLPQRIFLRAPNWVGDLVMATASFARVRRAWPSAEIIGGIRPYLRSLLAGSGWFDGLIETPPAGGVTGLVRQAADLRRGRFDLAVVLPNSLETALVPWLAGIPRRVGYRQGRPLLLTDGLRARPGRRPPWRRHGPRRVPEPMPQYYSALLDVLGLPAIDPHPQLTVTAEERAAFDVWLTERGVTADEPLVVLNAGASYGASKLWEPDRFAEVARRFQTDGARALLMAGPSEVAMVREIAAHSGALAMIDPVQPLGMLKPVMERASLCITTDSGPRHVAVAFDVPVVCLMGPTDRRYTDYCLERSIVLRKELDCSPCHRKVCPLGHRNCMRLIEVDEVVAAGRDLLGRFPRPLAPAR